MELLFHVLTGFAGIILYHMWVFREHLKQPKLLASKVFWSSYILESKFMWLWSGSFVLVVASIVYFQPELGEAITQLTGLDIANNTGAYFTFGLGVCSLSDTKQK